MIVLQTRINVKGISGNDICGFMLHCTDEDYQQWWSGTHLAFHTIKRYPDHLGNVVLFDEFVGKQRLRFEGVVTDMIPAKKLVWQLRKVVRLPAWLSLDLEDNPDGVEITHTLSIGFNGAGKILDPLLRMFMPKEFDRELEEHAQTEFRKLAEFLS